MTKTIYHSQTKTAKQYSQAQITSVSEKVSLRLDEIIDYFGLELTKSGTFYVGACPIHGGDKRNALNLYHTGNSSIGNWKCHSALCHDEFVPNIVGFVHGILSHMNCGWSRPGGDKYPFHKTVEFLLKFLDKDNIDDVEIDWDEVNRSRFVKQMQYITPETKKKQVLNISQAQLRASIICPSDYFISQRGYTPEILDKYDVGTCLTEGKPMSYRAVVPVYDDDHKSIIACSGRSIFEQCPLCGAYHEPVIKCPPKKYAWMYSKWRHNKGFIGSQCLYNYWFAREHIRKSGVAILVESPGNVWRLEEAGIHNSLGLLGAALSDGQKNILDKSGALALIVLTDPDPAGIIARDKIIEKCGNIYAMHAPEQSVRDIGETSVMAIKKNLLPIIDRVKRDLGL